MTQQKSLSALAWVLLLTMGVIWGGSFLANRMALETVPVFSVVAVRVGVAAVCMWAWVIWRKIPVSIGAFDAGKFLILGFLNNAIPFSLIVWGQQHISSGLASIINASTAIFTVFLASIFFSDERLSLNKALGVILGFLGVSIAIGLDAVTEFNLGSFGQLACVGAALSYAVAAMFGRGAFSGFRAEVIAAAMLTGSAVIMIPAALWKDGLALTQASPTSIAGLIYLSVIATALAYVLYYRTLALAGAGNLSLVTLLVVPVAIGLGAIVYDETLSTEAFIGFGVLAIGMVLIDGRALRRKILWRKS